MVYLIFQTRGNQYGIASRHIVEVTPILPLHPVPQAPSTIVGSVLFRGVNVPVYDLKVLLFDERSELISSSRLVFVNQRDGSMIALLAEKALETVSVDEPAEAEVESEAGGCFGGIIQKGEQVFQPLNYERLIHAGLGFTPRTRKQAGGRAHVHA